VAQGTVLNNRKVSTVTVYAYLSSFITIRLLTTARALTRMIYMCIFTQTTKCEHEQPE